MVLIGGRSGDSRHLPGLIDAFAHGRNSTRRTQIGDRLAVEVNDIGMYLLCEDMGGKTKTQPGTQGSGQQHARHSIAGFVMMCAPEEIDSGFGLSFSGKSIVFIIKAPQQEKFSEMSFHSIPMR